MSRCSEIYTTTTSKTISSTTCDPTVIAKTMLDLFVFFLSSNCATFSSISTIFLVVILIIKKYQYFILQNLQVLISACIWWDLSAASIWIKQCWYSRICKMKYLSIYTNLKFSFSWQTTANLKMMVRTFDLNFHQQFFI